MLKTAAGPMGTFLAGAVVELAPEVAADWMAAGAAVALEPAAGLPTGLASDSVAAEKPAPAPATDPAEPDELQASESGEDDLHGLTKAELVELAQERGVDPAGTKAEIIERLSAAAE